MSSAFVLNLGVVIPVMVVQHEPGDPLNLDVAVIAESSSVAAGSVCTTAMEFCQDAFEAVVAVSLACNSSPILQTNTVVTLGVHHKCIIGRPCRSLSRHEDTACD